MKWRGLDWIGEVGGKAPSLFHAWGLNNDTSHNDIHSEGSRLCFIPSFRGLLSLRGAERGRGIGRLIGLMT